MTHRLQRMQFFIDTRKLHKMTPDWLIFWKWSEVGYRHEAYILLLFELGHKCHNNRSKHQYSVQTNANGWQFSNTPQCDIIAINVAHFALQIALYRKHDTLSLFGCPFCTKYVGFQNVNPITWNIFESTYLIYWYKSLKDGN